MSKYVTEQPFYYDSSSSLNDHDQNRQMDIGHKQTQDDGDDDNDDLQSFNLTDDSEKESFDDDNYDEDEESRISEQSESDNESYVSNENVKDGRRDVQSLIKRCISNESLNSTNSLSMKKRFKSNQNDLDVHENVINNNLPKPTREIEAHRS